VTVRVDKTGHDNAGDTRIFRVRRSVRIY